MARHHGLGCYPALATYTTAPVRRYPGTWSLPKQAQAPVRIYVTDWTRCPPSDAQTPHLPTFPPRAHSQSATGCLAWLARQERDWTPDPRPRPDPLPCFLPRLQGASGQSDVSAPSTQSEPQTLACPPSRASSNDTCSAPPKHRRLHARQLYPPSSHIPSFDLFPVKSCQVSSCQLASALPNAHPACALAVQCRQRCLDARSHTATLRRRGAVRCFPSPTNPCLRTVGYRSRSSSAHLITINKHYSASQSSETLLPSPRQAGLGRIDYWILPWIALSSLR